MGLLMLQGGRPASSAFRRRLVGWDSLRSPLYHPSISPPPPPLCHYSSAGFVSVMYHVVDKIPKFIFVFPQSPLSVFVTANFCLAVSELSTARSIQSFISRLCYNSRQQMLNLNLNLEFCIYLLFNQLMQKLY